MSRLSRLAAGAVHQGLAGGGLTAVPPALTASEPGCCRLTPPRTLNRAMPREWAEHIRPTDGVCQGARRSGRLAGTWTHLIPASHSSPARARVPLRGSPSPEGKTGENLAWEESAWRRRPEHTTCAFLIGACDFSFHQRGLCLAPWLGAGQTTLCWKGVWAFLCQSTKARGKWES